MTALLITTVTTVILVSALCSLFEAVLYSIPMSRIEALTQRGKRSGKILQSLREKVERPITAILSLNTISNTAGAAIAGALASNVFDTDKLVYFSAAFTLAILLLSEVIPKTAGVVYARSLASVIAMPLHILTISMTPIVWLVGFVTRLITGGQSQDSVSPDEMVVMAKVGHRTGALAEGESKVIQNILTMRTKFAKQAMTPRTVVFSLGADLTVGEVYRDEKLKVHSRFPVFDPQPNDVIGLLYSRDVLAAAAADEMDTLLRDLAKPIHFIPDDTPLDQALQSFLERDDHLFALIDEYGGFAGVLTLEDVVEQVLGRQIVDETDIDESLRDVAMRRRQDVLAGRKDGPNQETAEAEKPAAAPVN